MHTLDIRPTTAADLPAITEIYEHAVRYGTATFELIPPDLTEMTRRYGVLMEGGFCGLGEFASAIVPGILQELLIG